MFGGGKMESQNPFRWALILILALYGQYVMALNGKYVDRFIKNPICKIQFSLEEGKTGICSGSIALSQSTIVTAAHCFDTPGKKIKKDMPIEISCRAYSPSMVQIKWAEKFDSVELSKLHQNDFIGYNDVAL